MKHIDFVNQINSLHKEIGGDTVNNIGSHKGAASEVWITSDDPDDDNEYEISSIEPNMRMGCGCWQGIEIHIKRTKDIS